MTTSGSPKLTRQNFGEDRLETSEFDQISDVSKEEVRIMSGVHLHINPIFISSNMRRTCSVTFNNLLFVCELNIMLVLFKPPVQTGLAW